jgi:positive regulator of sigma E activity
MTNGLTGSASHDGPRTITQRGVVESMEGNRAFVRIYQNSACGGCQLQGGCSSKTLGGNASRLVEAFAGEGVAAGSTVDLSMRSSDGMLSVLLSFVMPLVLVFTLILSFQSRGISEEVLAVLALGSIAGYYGILSLFRNALRSRISFTATMSADAVADACNLQYEN